MSEEKVLNQTSDFVNDNIIKKLSYSKSIHPQNGEPSYISALTQNGANLDLCNISVDTYGNTFLHRAIQDEVLEKLLKTSYLTKLFELCINSRNKKGETPLDIALNIFFDEDTIGNNFNQKTSLFLKYIDILLKHGAKLEKTEKNIILPMVLECKTNYDVEVFTDILNSLNKDYVDYCINSENEKGETLLDIALYQLLSIEKRDGLVKLIDWLIKNGATLKEPVDDLDGYRYYVEKLFNFVKDKNLSTTIDNFLWNQLIYINELTKSESFSPDDYYSDFSYGSSFYSDFNDDIYSVSSCDTNKQENNISKDSILAVTENKNEKPKQNTKIDNYDIPPESVLTEMMGKMHISFTNYS